MRFLSCVISLVVLSMLPSPSSTVLLEAPITIPAQFTGLCQGKKISIEVLFNGFVYTLLQEILGATT